MAAIIAASGDGPSRQGDTMPAVSEKPLLRLAEAREIVVAAAAPPLPAAPVAVIDSAGLVLAEDVRAAADVPGFANSAMDGFAIRSGPEGRELRITDESRAGRPATSALGEGEAIRISTGAPVPAGADAVIPVENVEERDGAIVARRETAPHANLRDPGEDMGAGETVLRAGTTLGPAALAVAVAAGRAQLTCAPRPRVTVLATGDELAPAGAPLGPGQIHNSNAPALARLSVEAGARAVRTGEVPDDRAATEEALVAALEESDVVILSGGVSVGPHDHVKPALASLSVEERFWRVALKPGKPVWFGTRGDTLVLGLPGNPVSAFVCFVLFARPALRALQGAEPLPPALTALLEHDQPRNPSREEAVRVRLRTDAQGRLLADSTGAQDSHLLSSLLGADALALVPPAPEPLPAGSPVAVERI